MIGGFSIGIVSSLSSCGSNAGDLPLSSAINTAAVDSAANTMLGEAKAYESSGVTRKALSIHRDITKKYPYTHAAGEARFSEARILDQRGNPLKAFEAYQDLIVHYPGSPHYATAIKRQESIAYAAANGNIKNNFLGMKTRISSEQTSRMLARVRENAPGAISAPKAQYTIGQVWQKNGNAEKAIAAYQRIGAEYGESSFAPEALYQTGQILILKAEKGNHNKANVNQARDIFQNLIQRYPRHSRAADARKSLAILASQDIQRSFDTAEFYRKKGNTKSAIFYYREVLGKTEGGNLHNQAKQHISELGG